MIKYYFHDLHDVQYMLDLDNRHVESVCILQLWLFVTDVLKTEVLYIAIMCEL